MLTIASQLPYPAQDNIRNFSARWKRGQNVSSSSKSGVHKYSNIIEVLFLRYLVMRKFWPNGIRKKAQEVNKIIWHDSLMTMNIYAKVYGKRGIQTGKCKVCNELNIDWRSVLENINLFTWRTFRTAKLATNLVRKSPSIAYNLLSTFHILQKTTQTIPQKECCGIIHASMLTLLSSLFYKWNGSCSANIWQ